MATITSTASAPVAVTVPTDNWVLSDPLVAGSGLLLHRSGQIATAMSTIQVPLSFTDSSKEALGVFYGWGNPNPIVQRSTIQDPTFTLTTVLIGYTEKAVFDTLTGRVPANPVQHTLLLRSDMGDAWYIVVGPDITYSLARTGDRATNPLWLVTAPCTVTSMPAGNGA